MDIRIGGLSQGLYMIHLWREYPLAEAVGPPAETRGAKPHPTAKTHRPKNWVACLREA